MLHLVTAGRSDVLARVVVLSILVLPVILVFDLLGLFNAIFKWLGWR